ncbi:hypothetical protein KC19_VG099000 [Ceratodon purpureus]|uniref:Uncharacterized protein n=1 Tax=Ceratodon purpureus TaxID=3225 RepID=A0A8T0HNP9_CERPU|nr:hypothetical protein KC19_VG099000 [Ceratodon purpureus]
MPAERARGTRGQFSGTIVTDSQSDSAASTSSLALLALMFAVSRVANCPACALLCCAVTYGSVFLNYPSDPISGAHIILLNPLHSQFGLIQLGLTRVLAD